MLKQNLNKDKNGRTESFGSDGSATKTLRAAALGLCFETDSVDPVSFSVAEFWAARLISAVGCVSRCPRSEPLDPSYSGQGICVLLAIQCLSLLGSLGNA